jgi:PAS domain S-box-containing protein
MLGDDPGNYLMDGTANLDEAWTNLLHPDDRERAANHFAHYLETGSAGLYENHFRMRHMDGSWVWILSRGQTLHNDDGSLSNITVGTHINITESKQAEEELQLSEITYREIFNAIDDSMFIHEIHTGMVLDVNDAVVKMFGYDKEEMQRSNMSDLCISDELYNGKRAEALIKKAASGQTLSFEWLNKRKDGSLFYSENTLKYVKIAGQERVLAIVRDITEKKQKEIKEEVMYGIANATFITNDLKELSSEIKTQLSKLIDTSNFYIALYDKTTGMLSTPYDYDEKDSIEEWPATKSMTGLVISERKTILIKKPDILKLMEDGAIQQVGNMCEVWLGAPLILGQEAIGAVVLQDYNSPDAYDEGSRYILEFISYQISLALQRKKTIEDLVIAKDKAQESDRLKSAFLANMSHEIRTPMNGILGFAELLKDTQLSDDTQQQYIDMIEQGGERMLNIINDIVNISRIEAGSMTIIRTELCINKQLDYIYGFFEPQAKAKGLQMLLSNKLEENISTTTTDKEKLLAILTNLVKNAIKYSHKGIITFGCKLNGAFFEFFVRDTGIGIPKDRQQAVFDRFVQADIEVRDAHQGAGPGLSISKAYKEKPGGKIWLKSETGKGSVLYFTIPLK